MTIMQNLSYIIFFYCFGTNMAVLSCECNQTIVHFTVVCLVTWSMNESEAGVNLVWIQTLLLFSCKFLIISMTTTSLT